MKEFEYQTEGTCSRRIVVKLQDDELRDVEFHGGCNGNLKAIRKLVQGRPVQEVVSLLEGIECDDKATSCADQLAQALKRAVAPK